MRYRRLIKIRYLFYLNMVLLLLGGVSSQANAQRGGAPVDQTGSLTTQQEEAQKITTVGEAVTYIDTHMRA